MSSVQPSRIRVSTRLANDWRVHRNYWKKCEQCGLCEQRDKVVLYRGNIPCNILFIGEAPGKSEDVIGFPFVGEAGQLLNQLIDKAFDQTGYSDNKLQDIQVGFTNIVCCLPLDSDGHTRPPTPKETAECRERLMQIIKLSLGNVSGPKAIILVGATAEKSLRDITLPTLKPPYVLNVTAIKHPASISRQEGGPYSLSCTRVINKIEQAIIGVIV